MIETSNINVKLKPIFNVKPGVYIPIIYSLILLTILLSLTVIPGIIKNGSYVTITSTPTNASVYIDDIRVGSTPIKSFVIKGNKKIELKKNNFSVVSKEVKISGNIFFSLFKPKNELIHFSLTSDSGDIILKNGYNDAAKWSLINSDDISRRYRIPNIISSPVSTYYSATNFNKDILSDFLTSSIKLVTNEFILSDYLRALAIFSSDKKLPSISTIRNSSNFINSLLSEQAHIPLLLYNKILVNRESDINSEYYKKLSELHRIKINKNAISFEEPIRDIKINNLTFKNVPKSQITPIDVNFIHHIENKSFYISEYMISKESYFEFVEENQDWSIENFKNLLTEGLVDNYYLDFPGSEDYITNISYYAAQAWCEWANNKYDIPDGYKLTLPSENMWFSATLYGVVKNIDAWQWTNQGFFLYDHFLTDKTGLPLKSFTDTIPRLVVGKNKFNTKAESSRGVQDANWCTPFISFRPVLVKE